MGPNLVAVGLQVPNFVAVGLQMDATGKEWAGLDRFHQEERRNHGGPREMSCQGCANGGWHQSEENLAGIAVETAGVGFEAACTAALETDAVAVAVVAAGSLESPQKQRDSRLLPLRPLLHPSWNWNCFRRCHWG